MSIFELSLFKYIAILQQIDLRDALSKFTKINPIMSHVQNRTKFSSIFSFKTNKYSSQKTGKHVSPTFFRVNIVLTFS